MKTILHVDDSETMRELIKLSLKNRYNVVNACDGKNGLSSYQATHPDLIITDINMPVMNGFEMIEEIRNINKEIGILVVTTESQEELKQKGYKVGADGWITKPFKPNQISDMIDKFFA